MDFAARVVVITGAGGSLGRSHALLMAKLGARIVVNDVGETEHGFAADLVVEEIRRSGGEAVVNRDSVADGTAIIECAMDHFGRVDAVVNNAGILRDKSFQNMTEADWQEVFAVHVHGAFAVTKAAWSRFRDASFGRVVMTTSANGLYGAFGQVNYAAAKMALVGMANALAVEGSKYNILVNTVAPVALSQLTEALMSAEIRERVKPAYVSPLVARLCHPSCHASGQHFEAGGGWFGQVRLQRSFGVRFPLAPDVDASEWTGALDMAAINDFSLSDSPQNVQAAMRAIFAD